MTFMDLQMTKIGCVNYARCPNPVTILKGLWMSLHLLFLNFFLPCGILVRVYDTKLFKAGGHQLVSQALQ